MKPSLIGIDYGSKLAGTTVISYFEAGFIQSKSSVKKSCADQFLLKEISRINPSFIYVDAPLSLPGIYTSLPGCQDYFYRKCDKEVGAMSPMFIGGLTARAMQFCESIKRLHSNAVCKEVYPGAWVRSGGLSMEDYKNNWQKCFDFLQDLFSGFNLRIKQSSRMPDNWHYLDSLICLLIGLSDQASKARVVGDAYEGLIFY